MSDNCGNCLFMHETMLRAAGMVGGQKTNVCRRFPPTVEMVKVNNTIQPISQFPPVGLDTWCGEHRERPQGLNS